MGGASRLGRMKPSSAAQMQFCCRIKMKIRRPDNKLSKVGARFTFVASQLLRIPAHAQKNGRSGLTYTKGECALILGHLRPHQTCAPRADSLGGQRGTRGLSLFPKAIDTQDSCCGKQFVVLRISCIRQGFRP